MNSSKNELALLHDMIARLSAGFGHLPDAVGEESLSELAPILMELADKLRNNDPYFHPLYAGQMLKPPHPVARLAYCLSMYINPNNHAFEGGRATTQMETECVGQIAAMVGWGDHLGHLCSGGTVGNLEALWVAGKISGGKKIVASSLAHYTHERCCELLKLPFGKVEVDHCGRMSLERLEEALADGTVGTVVVTLGTTSCGSVDPLDAILELKRRYGFRVHVDAAYGGYFSLSDNLSPSVQRAFDCLSSADSIVIDPHKHGLQPYGCGCVLFSDPSVAAYYRHGSPYTYFDPTKLHPGEISFECSRPGSSAAALWATQKYYPLVKGGKFARDLTAGRRAALGLYERLKGDRRFVVCFPPDLDIIFWLPRCDTASSTSAATQALFDIAAENDLYLALVHMPRGLVESYVGDMQWDQPSVLCLRSCLMKAAHDDWQERIWQALDRAACKSGESLELDPAVAGKGHV
jgi:tyrosine decarboxylase / aspartate 1-decarboxylase